ncbi:50S ribosomal protein L10 [Leptospira ognonensis]|uniref:Large ribosomal subunit protein uL10 n=1 Tax=Leptospira ognonensis TaxID=2484945 RepID=A0A4R9JZQ6_9LEPT|nr:50S ribosomal protein L10 [Leptospira ognonensis]TGL57229.1 50S ribosomal protein L10 [Leptospira ognonensis]
MANASKIEAVAELKTRLEKRPNFILASYSGLTVEDMTNLRAQLRKQGSEMKVIKNNLFLRALKESTLHKDKSIDFGDIYKGPLAAIFSTEELPAVAKVCKDFAKDKKDLDVKTGYFDGQVLDKKGVESIAGLPSKQELLAQIARGLNAPSTQIASGMNQIIASLARGIKAIGEKNG